jgi:transglutaminase-like putative cysteine protease
MSETRRSRLPWRRRRAAAKPRPLLEHGALPWLLAVAVATTLPHAEFLPGWLSAVCCAALAGRAWLWLKNGRLPRRWLLALVAVAGAAGIAWQYRALFGRDPGIALLVFFMALKPMEVSERRDGLVLVMLGFFLLLTHYFNSENIITGAWLFASAILLTATLLRMYGGAQSARGIFRYATLLIAQSLPFMLILFLLFPRIQGPLWGMPRDAYAGLSGLADQISPGSLDQLILSGELAFRVQFAAGMPDRSRLYWRGPALDSYDGRVWRSSFLSTSTAGREPAKIEADEASAVDYTITLEAHDRRWLLALDLPVALPGEAALSPTLEVLANRPVRYRARFAFRSATDYVAQREEEPRLLQLALRLPREFNPRSRELAEAWRRELVDAEKISAAALRLFRTENFFYTLQPPRLGEHAVDEFLFETRRGFCEHYASAYVALMRAAGVPARVVIGYQGGELNPVDGTLTVYQSDAHAWAEIWLEGRGWRRVDPTAAVAPSRIEQGIDAALPEGESRPALMRFDSGWLAPLRTLRFRWEAINNAWDQWVLGYDSQRQHETLARLGLKDADWQSMFLTMTAASGAVLLLIVGRMLFRRTKSVPEVRLWHRFCARLESFGIQRAPWEGPFDLAARVALEAPALAPLVRRAADRFAELRYGGGRRELLRDLRACVQELASRKGRRPGGRNGKPGAESP